MIDTIQRSLLADLKQNPTFQASVSRKVYDELHKLVMHSTVTQRTELYKSLNACLIGQEDPVFELPSGSSISLSGRPELVRVLRQALGFFSRLNSNVDEQTRLRQLEETKTRVSRAPSFNISPEDREQMCRFIDYILGPCPHPDTWPMKHGPGAVAEGNKAAKGNSREYPESSSSSQTSTILSPHPRGLVQMVSPRGSSTHGTLCDGSKCPTRRSMLPNGKHRRRVWSRYRRMRRKFA